MMMVHVYMPSGCNDPLAYNYDSLAIIDDGKILENSSMKNFLSQLKNEKL